MSELAPPPAFGKKLRYGAEAALFFSLVGFFRILGVDAASAVGGFIGRMFLYRSRITQRARENLVRAFPEKPAAEIETILVAMWDNLGRTCAEYPHFDKFFLHGKNPRLKFLGQHHADAAFARGHGAILFSGHLANWEIMPFCLRQTGHESSEVYRPINNPLVNRWMVKQRATYVAREQIAKGPQGTRRMFTMLRAGKSVCVLVDQKTNEGIPVPFFGRDAMTTPAPAALALRLDASLIPASNRRLKGARFEITVHPPLSFVPTGNSDKDVRDLTALITAKMEDLVRANPSQWLWIHRRWPTKKDIATGKRGG